LAVVGVERDRSNMNSTLSEAINFIEKFNGIELINYGMELI